MEKNGTRTFMTMQPRLEDLAQYEVKPLVNPNDLAQYEVKVPEESALGYITRGAARTGSRLGEAILGLPGDIREGLKGLAISGVNLVSPESAQFFKEKEQQPKPFSLPTSSDIREKTAELTGGFTEPKTSGEAKADEFLTDFAMLALPVKRKIPFARAIGTDIAGHLAKEGIEKFGAGTTTQDITKLGTFFLAGLITPGKSARKLANDLYKQRDALIPAGADVAATNFVQDLKGLKAKLLKGVPGTKENAVLKYIDELLTKSAGGRIEIEELTNVKRQINERITELVQEGTFKRKDARQLFKPLGRYVEDAIELYGTQSNAPFLKAHKQANEVWGAIEESGKVSSMVSNLLKGHHLKTPIGTLFTGGGAAALGGAIYAHPALAGPIIGTAGAAYGVNKAVELMNRVRKSPTLRKYYQGVVAESLKGNSAAALKNLQNLDKAMEHDLRVRPETSQPSSQEESE